MSSWDGEPTDLTMSTPVRRMTVQISEQLEDPLQLADLADASGISDRSLQKACARDLGMSPMRYLRLVRLHSARRLLTRAAPTTTTTVTELAQRLRFSSPSRFASTYQAQFGELPSATLRRQSILEAAELPIRQSR